MSTVTPSLKGKLIHGDETSVEYNYKQYLIESNFNDKTIEKYVDKVCSLIGFLDNKGLSIYDCKKNHVLEFLKSGKSVSPHTFNNYLTYLRQFFKWMQSELHMPDITVGIKRKPITRKFYKDSIPQNAINDLYQYFEGRVQLFKSKNDKRYKPITAMRDVAYLGLLITLGSRAGLTTFVKLKDIREKITNKGNVTLVKIKDKGKETGTERPIPKFVFDAIERYVEAKGSYSPDDFLFVAHNQSEVKNKPISYNMMWKRLTAGFIAIGIKNKTTHKYVITPHSLRHSLAEMILKRHGTVYLQKFYNHSSITTTQMYAGRDFENELFENPPDVSGMIGIE